MKRVVLLLLFLVSGALARADWSDVREGMDGEAVLVFVGTPLIVSKSRSGAQETWTYDDGAYVLFERGRVSFWSAPRPKRTSRARAEGKA